MQYLADKESVLNAKMPDWRVVPRGEKVINCALVAVEGLHVIVEVRGSVGA